MSLRKGAAGKAPNGAIFYEFYYSAFLVHTYDRNDNGEVVHHDVILDAIEVLQPMLVATASVDKLIRLISLKERRIVGVFTGHKKGVRQLDFTSYGEGYMLSCGFEAEAVVWSLEGGLGAIQSGANRSTQKVTVT